MNKLSMLLLSFSLLAGSVLSAQAPAKKAEKEAKKVTTITASNEKPVPGGKIKAVRADSFAALTKNAGAGVGKTLYEISDKEEAEGKLFGA
ncbi:MAG: hypothetical protein J6331_00480, partial [Lentisphaeria bacterium]|nr:hypothetical protein [Lentisphaeria bacterium]